MNESAFQKEPMNESCTESINGRVLHDIQNQPVLKLDQVLYNEALLGMCTYLPFSSADIFLTSIWSRVFIRESRSDDELLFKTTGSIRLKRVKLISNVPYYLNVGIVMVCLYGTLEFLLIHYKYLPHPPHRLHCHFLLLAALLALASMVQLPTIVKHMKDHVCIPAI